MISTSSLPRLPKSLTAALTALSIAAAATVSPSAHAGSCTSAAKVFSDIWDKYGVYAVAAGCAAGSAAAGGLTFTTCFTNANTYAAITEQMVTFWNDSANNSWSTIGPRRLEFNKTLTGTIVGPTERLFVTETPVDKDSVTITVKKTDGKQENNITICKIDQTNKCTVVGTYTFANGDSNIGKEYTKTITGTRGYLIVVHTAAAKANLNEFHYSIKATKK